MKALHEKQLGLLKNLIAMPSNLVKMHGSHNLPEFVLHELALPENFNLAKIGYFVDNPDFDCVKGVVGYKHTEAYKGNSIWDNAPAFTKHMENAPFNQQVRDYLRRSIKRGSVCDQDIIGEIATTFSFNSPSYYCWRMRHDNHGLILYEYMNGHDHWDQTDFSHALHLLSLCPIF
jgi:hypothetical protein